MGIKNDYTGIFRVPVIGRAGGKPVDLSYLESVKDRARRIERACRRKKMDQDMVDDRQLGISDV